MSLVGTRPILPDELEQYELHHRAMICSRNGRMMSIPIRNWHRRRTLTDSKAKKTDDRAYIANEISTIVWW